MQPEISDDSARFGVWPAVVGVLVAAAVIATMFALATGMR